MIKGVLFDIDGVLIQHKQYFGESLSSDMYKHPSLYLSGIYKTDENRNCDKGHLEITTDIEPFLKNIEWDKSVEEYLDQQYEFEAQYIDFEILEDIKEIRKMGIITVIASNQNHYRKKYLLNKINANNTFDDYYFSSDIGYVKSENKYWEKVLSNINNKYKIENCNELLFIDDLEVNIMKAKEFEINSCLVKCREDIEEVMVKIKEGVV